MPAMAGIWNEVVRDGVAFPQTEELASEEAASFSPLRAGAPWRRDVQSGEVLGMYILHPNNVGRCGHIANASYAVSSMRQGAAHRRGPCARQP